MEITLREYADRKLKHGQINGRIVWRINTNKGLPNWIWVSFFKTGRWAVLLASDTKVVVQEG